MDHDVILTRQALVVILILMCGLVPDRLAGHDAVLPERHQHPPFRHANSVASRVDLGQRLRRKARHHIELIGQERFQLQRRVVARRRLTGHQVILVNFAGALRRHGANMANFPCPRNGGGSYPAGQYRRR